jgi:hypothetical protein
MYDEELWCSFSRNMCKEKGTVDEDEGRGRGRGRGNDGLLREAYTGEYETVRFVRLTSSNFSLECRMVMSYRLGERHLLLNLRHHSPIVLLFLNLKSQATKRISQLPPNFLLTSIQPHHHPHPKPPEHIRRILSLGRRWSRCIYTKN